MDCQRNSTPDASSSSRSIQKAFLNAGRISGGGGSTGDSRHAGHQDCSHSRVGWWDAACNLMKKVRNLENRVDEEGALKIDEKWVRGPDGTYHIERYSEDAMRQQEQDGIEPTDEEGKED